MAYESKRAEFRNYLDRSGAYNALLRALKFLSKEDPKPEKMIYYVRHKLCETCPQDEKYDAMADETDRLSSESLRLERELDALQSQERTAEEIAELCSKGLQALRLDKEYHESYLLDVLTEDIIEELKNEKTSHPGEVNLFDCVEVGFRRHDTPLGVAAPDAECFEIFSAVFEPCIKKAYNYKADDIIFPYETDWGELSQIPNIDPEEKCVTEAFIMVSRNISGFPFAPKLCEDHFAKVEDLILKVANTLKGEYAGTYLKLENFNSKEQALLFARGLCFKADDPRLKAAKCYRFWPAHRGIYSNEAENFAIFVHWVDHLRVKSFAKNGDLGRIYYSLLNAFQVFESGLYFAKHETYGFLSPDVLNLGSGIIAGVTLKLPYLTQMQPDQFEKTLNYMGLVMKKLNKEKQILKVEIAPSIDRNEYAQIKTLSNACEFLIKSEKENKLCAEPPAPVKVEHKPPGDTTTGDMEGELDAEREPTTQ